MYRAIRLRNLTQLGRGERVYEPFLRVGGAFLAFICKKNGTPILDEIDPVLATHYGFMDEELDFIPSTRLRAGPSMKLRAGNYDIKYRMGRDAETEEE